MKTPAFEKILNDVAKVAFGRERTNTQCVVCGTTKVKPEDFRDALSRKEFGISRMCQACQNDIYDESEGE